MAQVLCLVGVCPVVVLFAKLFVLLHFLYLFLNLLLHIMLVLCHELLPNPIISHQIWLYSIFQAHELHELIFSHFYYIALYRRCSSSSRNDRGSLLGIVSGALAPLDVFKLCLEGLEIFILCLLDLWQHLIIIFLIAQIGCFENLGRRHFIDELILIIYSWGALHLQEVFLWPARELISIGPVRPLLVILLYLTFSCWKSSTTVFLILAEFAH